MQIYFHSRLCSYLSRVPILVEGTVCVTVAARAVVKSTFVESKTSPSPKRFESKSK